MPERNVQPVRKPFPLIPILVVVLGLGILFAAGGFTFAATQEQRDSFCASCHTQPESMFYQRSTAAQPVDLAAFHTTQKVGCIGCHSGPGIVGRMQAELLGAENVVKWYTGTAVQPAPLNHPISDQNCLKCHQDVTQRGFTPKEQITLPVSGGRENEREGRNNHWHQFMARWQAATANAGNCTSCHSGHGTTATADSGFMNAQDVQATCDACHQAIRRED